MSCAQALIPSETGLPWAAWAGDSGHVRRLLAVPSVPGSPWVMLQDYSQACSLVLDSFLGSILLSFIVRSYFLIPDRDN